MKAKSLLIIVFGILACVLIIDYLVPEPLIGHDSNVVYALGPRPPRRPMPQVPPSPAQPVPEPSTLVLLGTGAAGIASYLYYKTRKNRK